MVVHWAQARGEGASIRAGRVVRVRVVLWPVEIG